MISVCIIFALLFNFILWQLFELKNLLNTTYWVDIMDEVDKKIVEAVLKEQKLSNKK
jgi:hypothetical protein